MAHDDDVIVRIEFLMSARRNVAHRNVFCSFDVGGFVFPGLANIEQRKCFAILLERLDLSGRDFEVHNMILFVETGFAPSHAGARHGKPRLTENQTSFFRSSAAFPSVVKLTSAATAQSTPVPIRALRTAADGTLLHSVNPQPTTKLITSRLKITRSRRQRVSSARPASRRIHTM